MKTRLLGRLLMAAAILLHFYVALQQGEIFLTEEGLVRTVLDSDGIATENRKLRVHQVSNPATMIVATTEGGDDGGPVKLVYCSLLRGQAREERLEKFEGRVKNFEEGDRYFAKFLKLCRKVRGPLAPEYDDVKPNPGTLESVWGWLCDMFHGILQAVQDFLRWMMDTVRWMVDILGWMAETATGLKRSGGGLGPTQLDAEIDIPVNRTSQRLTHATLAGQDRVYGRTKAIATGLKSCYQDLEKCEHVIMPGQTQDGLYNGGDRELKHCGCMAKFSSCIQKLNLPLSAASRQAWHHPEPKCYHHELQDVCNFNVFGLFCARWELKAVATERVLPADSR